MTAVAEPIVETPTAAARRAWTRPAVTVLVLSAVAWFAHFSSWRQIGFFSDDQSFAVLTMAWTPADAAHQAGVLAFAYPEPQGRPLGFLLGVELPYLGWRAAGVFGMFAVGWVILSLNAALLYGLLARRLPRPLPAVGALVFLLFPADTTRPFLCHAHILQPSITFALAAAHLMLCRSWSLRAIGYPVAGLCLITYETALLPLLAVPLLDGWAPVSPRLATARRAVLDQPIDTIQAPPSGRSLNGRLNSVWVRRSMLHLAALAVLVGVVAVTRSRGGEYRAVGATGGKGTVAAEVVLGSIRGPLAVVDACVRRPWRQVVAVLHRPGHAAIVALATSAFAGLIATRRVPSAAAVWRALAFGVAAVGVSYLLCFTHYPPTCEEGQSTSVHTAAAIGSAAVAAGIFAAWSRRSRRWATAGGAAYLGLLLGSALDEQAGYARLWHERQSFWRQTLALCPDLADRTVVLCDGAMPQPLWFMPVNLWSDAMVPAQVYQFPDTDRLPPIVAAFPRVTGQDWRSAVRRDGDRLVWRTPPCNCPAGQALAEADTILLRVDSAGRVTRARGSVDVAGRPFHVKDPPPAGTVAAFPRLPFYGVLVGETMNAER